MSLSLLEGTFRGCPISNRIRRVLETAARVAARGAGRSKLGAMPPLGAGLGYLQSRGHWDWVGLQRVAGSETVGAWGIPCDMRVKTFRRMPEHSFATARHPTNV